MWPSIVLAFGLLAATQGTLAANQDPRRDKILADYAAAAKAADPTFTGFSPNVAEVEKRFDRDCKAALGRTCTARDRGDFLTFLISQ